MMELLKSKSFLNSSAIIAAILIVGANANLFGQMQETIITWLGVIAVANTFGHKAKDVLNLLIGSGGDVSSVLGIITSPVEDVEDLNDTVPIPEHDIIDDIKANELKKSSDS
jgi:hypothetical protein